MSLPRRISTIRISEMADRIEEASGSIVMDIDTWEKLCLLLLPEWYQDRPDDDRGPTMERPGSLEKQAVMNDRVNRGRSPFHAGDAVAKGRPGRPKRVSYSLRYQDGTAKGGVTDDDS